MTLARSERERLVRIVTEEVKKFLAAQGRVPPPRPACKTGRRRVITEAVVRNAIHRGEPELKAGPKAIVTPAAKDLAEAKGFRIIR